MQSLQSSLKSTGTQHPFRLLASAIVGRPIHISYLNNPDAKVHSDGERIYVPASDLPSQQRAEIVVQALLISGNSYSRSIISALVGRSYLKQRYQLLEVERCAQRLAHRLPTAFLKSVIKSELEPLPSTPEESLAVAKTSVKLPSTPEWYGDIYPIRLLRSRSKNMGDPLDSETLNELEQQLERLQKQLQDSDDDDSKKSDSFWQLLSSPRGKEGIIGKLFRDLLDMSSSADESPSEAGINSSMESVSSKRVGRLNDVINALRSMTEIALPSAFVAQESGAHSYREWDCQKGKYRENWVSVEEVEAWSEEGEESISDFKGGCNTKYQRLLAGLCFNVERHRNQMFGDDLGLDRLVEMATNIQAGFSGDERLYSANLKTRRDLGVQILVDVSSSTLEETKEGKKICDLQMEAAWQLCRAFSVLGDRVAMHGFHSWGRSLVRLQRLKNFNEPMGAKVEHRCKQLSIAGYTRCGGAIRHSVQQLKQFSGMPCNLLLVVSDGYPYDDQYEGEYAAEDTKKALEEARSEAVACVCISIGSDVNSQRLKELYGDANYLAVNEVPKLTSTLRPVIEMAIANTLGR